MNAKRAILTLAGFRRRLRSSRRSISRLVRRLSEADELADRIECNMAALLDEATEAGLFGKAVRGLGARPTPKRTEKLPVQLGPKPTAIRVDHTPQARGWMKVSIDGAASFLLEPRLARFVKFLLVDNGDSRDGLIGWWPVDEIAKLLGCKGHRKAGRHTVSQWIYLLKKCMASAGHDKRLIQTDRQRGVRFALKRGGFAPPAAPNPRNDAPPRTFEGHPL